MTSPLPEAASGARGARVDDDRNVLLAHIGRLEAELAAYRPPRPPPGWLRVKTVAGKLRLTPVAIYRAAREGKIASTKIGCGLWIAPIETRPARKKYKRRA